MSGKQAKRQRKLERVTMQQIEEQPKPTKSFAWGIPAVLFLSVISLTAFGFSKVFQSDDNLSVVTQQTDSTSIQASHTSIDDEEITPETWRGINLEIRKADGSIAKIDLLRPLWWVEEADAKVGGIIALSMPEMGIEGNATVVSIDPCQADSRKGDPRCRVVTGKFTHENAIVLDLYFNNNPKEPLGVTPNHPLWSATHNGWVEAGQLKVGEYVKTKKGIAQLTMRSQRPGRHKVYNLEVHKDHTYYVSNLGILVHNSCFPKAKELAKRLGTNEDTYHKVVKAQLKIDFRKQMKKLGTDNPDFGISKDGFIMLKKPGTKKSITTDSPASWYSNW